MIQTRLRDLLSYANRGDLRPVNGGRKTEKRFREAPRNISRRQGKQTGKSSVPDTSNGGRHEMRPVRP
jgi:hypothetical protein